MKENKQTAPRSRIWDVRYEQDASMQAKVAALREALQIQTVTARLLVGRGMDTPDVARAFMEKNDAVWRDPYGMADMGPAVERVLTAVADGERIAVYGDYDVDGVTSVSSLYLYLSGLGARVDCYIPSREKEGYGISRMAVDYLHSLGVALMITVDTGITANGEIRYAASLGMDTVVTDHHECHEELPTCCAVVNPHRPDCGYPFKELAGVGVVFKLICACEQKRLGCTPREALQACENLVDLVSIGTIADVMPLVDENRWIVSHGLARLEHTERCGLAALLDAIRGNGTVKSADGKSGASSRAKRKINTGLIGYGVAPRINAAGRISHAMKAVELLLAESPERAEMLAAELCEINSQRQVEENRIAEQAYRMIEEGEDLAGLTAGEPCVVVLEDDGWMQGIIGIVSSRITERYGVPSILISFEGATDGSVSDGDVGKGSGRSVKGLNLVDALTHCKDLLVRFGGHELAAGLSIRRCDIPAFRQMINEYARAHLTKDMTAVRYEADCEVDMVDLTMPLAEELTTLEPFGVANPTPVFMIRDMTVQRVIPLGAGKHTKLLLSKEGQTLPAVWFGTSPSELEYHAGDCVDVLFQLNINDYQNVRSLQMIVQDVRASHRQEQTRQDGAARYEAICGGAEIAPDEDVIPTREDLAVVYTMLRQDARRGSTAFSDRELFGRIQQSDHPMAYVKMRFVLRILDEIGVCRISEPQSGIFVFEINGSAPKTNIAASALWHKLQGQRKA